MASAFKDKRGGVISELVERNRLRAADLGVGGGGRIWLVTAMLVRNVEKYSPEPSRTGDRMGGGVYGGKVRGLSIRRTGERRLL